MPEKLYQPRLIDKLLATYLENFPAILLEGAKAVGKTSACQQVSRTAYYLDNENHLQLLSVSPEILLQDNIPILIDEWQKYPQIWDRVRRFVDNGLPEGSILMTGSNPTIQNDLHSGSGRIVSLVMRPFSIEERGLSENYIRISDFLLPETMTLSGKTSIKLEDYLEEIFKSGFPGIRNRKPLAREGLLAGYVENIITREFPENGYNTRKPDSLRNWLRAYSAAIASTTQFQTILEAATANQSSISTDTATAYRNALLMLRVIEEVPAWLGIGKLFPALAKAPKHFLADPALLTPLLDVTPAKLLKGQAPHPIGKINQSFIGQLFEAFIYQSLATYAEVNQLKLSHLRLQNGRREIDFILEDGKHNQLIAIEVKSATAIKDEDVKHLNWLEQTLRGEYHVSKLVVYMGEFAYTRKDGVHVVPAAMLGC